MAKGQVCTMVQTVGSQFMCEFESYATYVSLISLDKLAFSVLVFLPIIGVNTLLMGFLLG